MHRRRPQLTDGPLRCLRAQHGAVLYASLPNVGHVRPHFPSSDLPSGDSRCQVETSAQLELASIMHKSHAAATARCTVSSLRTRRVLKRRRGVNSCVSCRMRTRLSWMVSWIWHTKMRSDQRMTRSPSLRQLTRPSPQCCPISWLQSRTNLSWALRWVPRTPCSSSSPLSQLHRVQPHPALL